QREPMLCDSCGRAVSVWCVFFGVWCVSQTVHRSVVARAHIGHSAENTLERCHASVSNSGGDVTNLAIGRAQEVPSSIDAYRHAPVREADTHDLLEAFREI